MAFQHVPTLQSTSRLLLTPPSTWFSRMLVCAYFSLTTIGPACPTTWRQPNRGQTVLCFRCALYAIWDLSPPLPAASSRSGCRTVVILFVRVCLVCVFLLCHHRFRSPPFVQATEPWRFSFFFVRTACTPLLPSPIPSASIQAVESWLYL